VAKNFQEARKLAESFQISRQETEQLVAKQKLALGAFYKREKPFGWKGLGKFIGSK